MKTTTICKNVLLAVIGLTSLIFTSCHKEHEIVKVLEAPGWIKAEVGTRGSVTLTWPPVDGAEGYYIHCRVGPGPLSTYPVSPKAFRVGTLEADTTTFTHVNQDWLQCRNTIFAWYGVCMVDEKGNMGDFATCSVQWSK